VVDCVIQGAAAAAAAAATKKKGQEEEDTSAPLKASNGKDQRFRDEKNLKVQSVCAVLCLVDDVHCAAELILILLNLYRKEDNYALVMLLL